LQVPVFGVIENMSYLAMPDGSQMDVFGQGGGEQLAKDTGVTFVGQIPLDPALRVGGDKGTPIVIADPESQSAMALRKIAETVAEKSRAQSLQQADFIPIEVIE
jgi:ATP-binding protein involved in chromosome partitioning